MSQASSRFGTNLDQREGTVSFLVQQQIPQNGLIEIDFGDIIKGRSFSQTPSANAVCIKEASITMTLNKDTDVSQMKVQNPINIALQQSSGYRSTNSGSSEVIATLTLKDRINTVDQTILQYFILEIGIHNVYQANTKFQLMVFKPNLQKIHEVDIQAQQYLNKAYINMIIQINPHEEEI